MKRKNNRKSILIFLTLIVMVIFIGFITSCENSKGYYQELELKGKQESCILVFQSEIEFITFIDQCMFKYIPTNDNDIKTLCICKQNLGIELELN